MTIEANVAWGSAVGTGTTGPFAIPFPLYEQTWLTVLQVSNNVPTTMVLGTDYTFTSWTPDTKGQVQQPQITFTNAVAGGVGIVFLLTMPETQLTAITNFAAYFPNLTEAGLDTLTQMAQQIYEWSKKSLKAPDQEYSGNGVNLTLPPIASRALLLLGFDADGDVMMYNQSQVGSPIPYLGSFANQADLPASTTVALAFTQDAGQMWFFNTTTNAWQGLT